MAKKTWIKVKRGILEPKHIDQLGQAWYLYFYILDNADWDSGSIKEWKDKYAADELGKPLGMIREHRKSLEANDYIRTVKNRYDQTIIIKNWTNPRMYDGVVINEDSEKHEPCEGEENEGSGQSYAQSMSQSSGQSFYDTSKNLHSSSNHISHNHISTGLHDIQQEPCQNFYSLLQEKLNIPLTGSKDLDYVNDLLKEYGEEKLLEIAEWYAGLEDRNYATWPVLRAIDTAAQKWTGKPKRKSDNRKKIFEMLEEK